VWREAPGADGGAFRRTYSAPASRGPLAVPRRLRARSVKLRDPREIPFDKPPGAVRILFLGDSTSFGWLLRYDERIVHQTERIAFAPWILGRSTG
jgi:hypothetical protein